MPVALRGSSDDKIMRRHVGMLAVLSALAAVPAGCDGPAPATAAQAPGRDELEARVKALEGLIPDQAHIMADVGDHFTNLWFAGTAANWPLADFYLNETKSHLRWAVRRIPIRKDNQGRKRANQRTIIQCRAPHPKSYSKRNFLNPNKSVRALKPLTKILPSGPTARKRVRQNSHPAWST